MFIYLFSSGIFVLDPLQAKTWLSISECDVSACKRGACHNNATCIPDTNDINKFECNCQPGYFGDDCRQVVDHCKGDPCKGGLCLWLPDGRQCLCQYGRIGTDCSQGIIPMTKIMTICEGEIYDVQCINPNCTS